jgi:membrane protease YdiL (CAAX protease family)
LSENAWDTGSESVVGVTGGRAVGLVLGWALASFLARRFGIWPAMGSAAVLLGVLSVRWGGGGVMGAGRHVHRIPLGILVGIAMAAVTVLLYGPVTGAFPALSADVSRLYEVFRGPGIVGALVLMPVILTCEEVVWRGAVHGAIARRASPLLASAAGTALYAVAHVPYGSPALVLAALGAGFCWSLLRAYSDSLPAVVAAHAAWSYGVLLFYQSGVAT